MIITLQSLSSIWSNCLLLSVFLFSYCILQIQNLILFYSVSLVIFSFCSCIIFLICQSCSPSLVHWASLRQLFKIFFFFLRFYWICYNTASVLCFGRGSWPRGRWNLSSLQSLLWFGHLKNSYHFQGCNLYGWVCMFLFQDIISAFSCLNFPKRLASVSSQELPVPVSVIPICILLDPLDLPT